MLIFTATFEAAPVGFDVAGVTGEDDDPPPLHADNASANMQRTGLEKKRTTDPFRYGSLVPRAVESRPCKFLVRSGKRSTPGG
jgi:hypothetical protein